MKKEMTIKQEYTKESFTSHDLFELVACMEGCKDFTQDAKGMMIDRIRESLVGYLRIKEWVMGDLDENGNLKNPKD